MLEDREFLARHKVDETGRLIDISSLGPKRLAALSEHYRLKSRRAHSALMKELYAGIAEDVRVFMISGRLPVRIDALTFSKSIRIEDVKDLVRRYWNGRVFSDDDSDIDFYRQWVSRNVPYRRPLIPSDEVIVELHNLSKRENFSRILKNLAQYYRVAAPSLAERADSQMEYYLEYDQSSTLLTINRAKLWGHESLFFAILQGFFRHLAKTMAWQFSEDMDKSYRIEKGEATRFAKSICERLVTLGLMMRRR